MTFLLAGDIGGTKTILRLVKDESNMTQDPRALQSIHEVRYASRDFPDLVPMVRQFLAEAASKLGSTPAPEKACFAIAGPVVEDTSKLTNLGWSLETPRLIQELNIPLIRLINDFVAVGYGVLGLSESDLCTLQAGQPKFGDPIAVIGAGTGLGQGYLIHHAGGYQVYSSEGGHVDFAPRSELEFRLLHYLLDKYDINRISVERVVSGQGIVAIYQFLRDRQYANESPDVAEAVQAWEKEIGRTEKSVDPAAAISMAALEKRDRLSEQTMQIFIESYASEAGNLALKLLPYGGLFIAGGIAAKNLPLIQQDCFLKTLTDKGRMRRLLERVPVHVVTNAQVGLIGAALCASKLTGDRRDLPLVELTNAA